MRLITGTGMGSNLGVRTVVSNLALYEGCAAAAWSMSQMVWSAEQNHISPSSILLLRLKCLVYRLSWICFPSLENARRVLKTGTVILLRTWRNGYDGKMGGRVPDLSHLLLRGDPLAKEQEGKPESWSGLN